MRALNRTGIAVGMLVFALSGLAACGGGGSADNLSASQTQNSCSGSDCGTAMMTMTDAQGDFLNYVVTLKSVQLKKASGAMVETLPQTVQVDFAQLVDLSEVLSAGQIPSGDYVSANITVDYTGSTLIVDDGSASGLQVSPVDQDGNPVTQVTMSIQLDNKNHLVITPRRTSRLAFDFNLLASNTVDIPSAKVTVQPFVVASAVPADTKQIHVRGALVSADTANNDYIVNVVPFHMLLPTSNASAVGQVTVHVNAQTTYEIDGTAYQGSAGLTALAALPVNSPSAAFGALQTADMSFLATNVIAGTSMQSASVDRAWGNVIARSGDALTVRGVQIAHHDGTFEFAVGNITLNVGNGTVVTEEGKASGPFDNSDISVGQRIEAFGTMSRDSTTKKITFDATSGRVRLDITPLWGIVSSTTTPAGATAGSVTLNLQAIDGRNASVYNFAGTGTSTANDAKAASYVVNTQTLSLDGLLANAPTRMFGFVTPFGTAPPDFVASSLVDYSAVNATLLINWGFTGTTAPFSVINSSGLALDLTNNKIGIFHELDVGPVHTDLTKLASSPQIVADAQAPMQLYSIGHVKTHKIDNYNSFADFVTALSADLDGSNVAFGMTAQGHYSSATGTLSISHAIVVVNN